MVTPHTMLSLSSLLLSILIFLSTASAAMAGAIHLLADNLSPYQPFAVQLQKRLSNTPHKDNTGKVSLRITIGPDSLNKALQQSDKSPILATLITQEAFNQATRHTLLPPQISAIFREQPLQRLIALTHLATPSIQQVAILYDGEAPATANTTPLPLLLLQQTNNLRSTLNTVLPHVDALITTHNPRLYNAESFKNLLLSSYRQQKPLICHTSAMVAAGCIMGAHSSAADLLEETLTWIEEFQHNNSHEQIPRPRHSSYFSVVTNPKVARSLGLQLPHPSRLTQLLQAHEEERP